MKTATLVNLTARPKVVVLDHPAFRARRWGFRVQGFELVEEARGGGTRRPKLVRQAVLDSVTLPGRGKIEGLHPAIKNCAQVRTWLRNGEVAIVDGDAPPQEKTKPPAPRKRAAAASSNAGEGDSR